MNTPSEPRQPGSLAADPSLVPLGPPRNAWRVGERGVDAVRALRPARPLELAAAPKPIVIDAARTAMVVIDMQNDFCTPGGWLSSIGVDVGAARTPIEPLRALLPALRAAGVPVIWVNWGNRPDRANLSPALLHVYNGSGRGVGLGDPLPASADGDPRAAGSPVLQKDSWAAAVVDALPADPRDLHVDKYRMSGFWDTPLDSILRGLDVRTVLFGGVNADQCVLATLMDANFLGYDTLMVEDCSATTSPEFCWQATLYNVRQCFGFTVQSRAIHDALVARASTVTRSATSMDCYKIKAADTNWFALVADPLADGTGFVQVIEIFEVGGRTPPNVHADADEVFYVLAGEGVALCNGQRIPVRRGDSFLVRAGHEHVVENTGAGRLYCLTTMVPNEGFAELIRAGIPWTLDATDRAVLLG